ncbi:protein inscuteable homolog [Cimex lectularius]|uniref:Protein inscuteable homologue C-terminal domain-containing protein n=1 Tax=Cimex lectularius TaxID=79782 RepID=A0A8I6RMV0_CIMLE|nr:protein inscuteable homolog [Cimex lectularius]
MEEMELKMTNLNRSMSLQSLCSSSKEKWFGSLNNLDKCTSIEKYGSSENLPPPKHCSTPKSKISNYCNQKALYRNSYVGKKQNISNTLNPTPVDVWMEELRVNYASECMTSLQSKSLFSDMNSKIKMLVELTTKVIKILHQQTYLIAKEFDHIYRCLENNLENGVYALIESLVYHMIDVLEEHSNCGNNLDAYYQVLEMIDPITLDRLLPLPELIWKINALALDFSKKIDILLLEQIKIMVGVLEPQQNNDSLAIVMDGLNVVELQPDHLGNLLARCGGMTTLVQLLETCNNDSINTSIVKLLARVCCTPSAIKVFKDSCGLEILCRMLSTSEINHNKMKEGMLLLLQVTGPWLKYKIIPLEKYVVPIVSALTRLLMHAINSEMILIAAAGLANLSHEEISLKPIVNEGSVNTILTVIRNGGVNASIFLKEQAATIILNLSNKQEFRHYLCEIRVIPAILCFLKYELTSKTSSLIEATTYRVQYKAALTLSRLCNEREAVHQIQELQGVSRIIKLCKDGIEKNGQDGVITASMEALHKIMAFSKNEALQKGKQLSICSKQFVSIH